MSDFTKAVAVSKGYTDKVAAGKADLIGGKIPAAQLPSYVDDVVNGYYYQNAFYSDEEHTSLITPEEGIIYVDITTDNGGSYRWTGERYIDINSALEERVSDIESKESTWNAKQDSISDLAEIRSGAAAGASALQPASLNPYRTSSDQDEIDNTLQNNIDEEEQARIQSDYNLNQLITLIQALIPSQASAQNQLGDKAFINSSIATNTAYYIYKTVGSQKMPFDSLEELEAYTGTITNNDYAFVKSVDASGNTIYTRYKYNASTEEWAEEYELNNSSFTAAQWAALNSGMTSADKTKLDGIEEGAEKNAPNTVVDESYVHTDNNYSNDEKQKVADTETAQAALEKLYNERNLKIWSNKGLDLSRYFTAAQLHAKIAAEDFSGLEIGDYYPITLNGSYDDYGSYFVPSGTTYYSDAACTTEVGQYTSNKEAYWQDDNTAIVDTNQYVKMEDVTYPYTKTLNNAVVKMEIGAVNIYKNHGDTAIPAHLAMISRDLLPNTIRMRIANSKWHDFDTTKNPWRGSAAYETLNGPNGIIKLVEATELGQYIYAGPNQKGMRFLGDTWASEAATSPNSWAWMDRGKLFLPTESEVYGRPVWQTNGYACGNLYNQWPIFAGTARHLIKGAGDGGGRASWWLATAYSSTNFAYVDSYGYANSYNARLLLRVPLCFLLT